MSQSTTSARLDSADKAAFDLFCENVGMSASTGYKPFCESCSA